MTITAGEETQNKKKKTKNVFDHSYYFIVMQFYKYPNKNFK